MSSLNDYAVGATLRRRLLTKTNVVLAVIVLAVVIAIASTVMPSLVPKSDEERYLADQSKIDLVVLTYRTGYPGRPLKGGGYGRRSGVIGLGDAGKGLEFGLNATFAEYHRGTKKALKLVDVQNGEITTLGVFQTNPAGGSIGGTPSWEDVDGDGTRNMSAEKVYYDKAEPPPSVDHWNTTTVLEFRATDEYVVDSRDWFIDMLTLIEKEFLDNLPASASPDNHPDGKGSYSWYIDEDGKIKSLLYAAPTKDSVGYHAVYP